MKKSAGINVFEIRVVSGVLVSLSASMRRFFIVLILSLLAAIPTAAWADNDRPLTYYKCDHKQKYFEITTSDHLDASINEKNIIDPDLLGDDGKTVVCRLDGANKVTVDIAISVIHPRNNNVIVSLNNKVVDDLTFDVDQDHSTRIRIKGKEACVQNHASKTYRCLDRSAENALTSPK